MQVVKVCCCIAVFVLAGCASSGHQVNKPMLQQDSMIVHSQILPQAYQLALENTQLATLDYENQRYSVSTRYVSALGHSCIKLSHDTQRDQNLLFCRSIKSSDSPWFKVANVLASLEGK